MLYCSSALNALQSQLNKAINRKLVFIFQFFSLLAAALLAYCDMVLAGGEKALCFLLANDSSPTTLQFRASFSCCHG